MRLPPFAVLGLCLAPLLASAEIKPKLAPDHASGVYAPGETVSWTVTLGTPDAGEVVPEFTYKITKDGKTPVSQGTVEFVNGTASLTASRADSGSLITELYARGKYLPVATSGAIYAPEKIKPSAPAPADFDAFWKEKLAELARVPVNPVLEKVADAKNTPGVDYYKVMLDNIRGTKVRGQLARPSAPGKYPALITFQFAGVYALEQNVVVGDGKAGWLALNISAHDLPIDAAPDFYKNLKDGELKNYIYIGSEDRETSYFLRMFLGCARAIDYVSSLPDWDGKTLIVTGASQGGLQAFAAAGLSPKVTGLMTLVPAGCDVYGPLAGRGFGWPYWLSNWGPKDRDMKKVETTAGYFDAIYFAARTKAPALVAYGLNDTTSRPTGVAAAINVLQGPKEALILPLSDHHGAGGAQAAYFKRASQWKSAILLDKPFPPAPVP
ncbi:MAG: acetylxylan esterase [Opitutaceae bacterium]|jgi:cephalosporin-C deacetylase-like acetyl esterase